MEYFSPGSGLSKRDIEIYAKNARYTAGFCHLRNEIRKFRNSRIVSITLLDKKFEISKDFDKKEFL
ncbi:MAG: WYL domain-containing protein [Nanoarchaeota archaeon]|nr:WYL domain-containing protein [Nanoarchaeota archaeon]MBU4451465.1 WYL domain-containing protein [Nanoarchaeota archaeon]MCG2724300.1 WYL domain-containing protein [archaeon]